MEKTFNHSFLEVFTQCKAALRDLDMNIDFSSKKEELIQASTKGSLLSWGEDVEIYFKSLGVNKTKVTVNSEASAQLFSWGKDSTNERNIINALIDRLG
jgi:hypothetical protein